MNLKRIFGILFTFFINKHFHESVIRICPYSNQHLVFSYHSLPRYISSAKKKPFKADCDKLILLTYYIIYKALDGGRENGIKLCQGRFRWGIRKKFFTEGVVRPWNRLSRAVVNYHPWRVQKVDVTLGEMV